MNRDEFLPKLLFYVTEDWYFCSHRLALAVAAKKAGYDVVVVTRLRDHDATIRRAGLRVVPLNSSRRSINPIVEFGVVLRLIGIYRREQPDLVHHVAVKPVVYGSLAARLVGISGVVNALAGMGWVFSSRSNVASALQPLLRIAFRYLLRRGKVIVQNGDDVQLLKDLGVEKVNLVRGSGVDTTRFVPRSESDGLPVVMLVARMIWPKGVAEFVEAARALRTREVRARFVLVGEPDPENPSSIPEAILRRWATEGVVEYWGRCKDMAEILTQAHVACLPSYYREGVPKSLIEAAACGLPIVTADAPGCREIVVDGKSGLLVPPRDAVALADALQRLILDPDLRARMGRHGRRVVVEEFSEPRVVEETLGIYRELLSPRNRTKGVPSNES